MDVLSQHDMSEQLEAFPQYQQTYSGYDLVSGRVDENANVHDLCTWFVIRAKGNLPRLYEKVQGEGPESEDGS